MLEDRRLIRRFNAGDTQAMRRIYEKYRSDLFRMAGALLHDRPPGRQHDMETMRRVCHAHHLSDTQSGVHGTPYVLAADVELYQEVPTQERPGSNGFDKAVKEAVDNLPAMYREVVVLHYYSNLSHKEIESVLGVSGDVVKGRLARARFSSTPK